MRIAVVHSFYSSDSPSGENSVVESQVQALAERGHTVRLISRSTDTEQNRVAYPAYAAMTASGYAGPSPTDELNKFDPEVIHVHNLFPNWGSKWIKQWGSRTVSTLHNYRAICASSILWRDGSDCNDCITKGSLSAVKHRCYRNSAIASIPLAIATRDRGKHSVLLNHSKALIVLNKEAQAQFLSSRPDLAIRVIPNFVQPGTANPAKQRSSWLYVGRLTSEKGIPWLLQYWPLNVNIRIAGAGPLSSRVQNAAEQQPERFTFLGIQTPEQIQVELSNSQGLIVPSLWSEGIPTVALEALAQGTPVIVSSRCKTSADLTYGGAGVVFEPNDPSTLQSALNLVAENVNEMSNRARQLHRTRYSQRAWLDSVEEVYESVRSR